MRGMSATRPTPYERYLPWRRWVEVGFWVGLTVVNAVANSYTVVTDIRKNDLAYATWEPVVWEWSSGIMWLALAWPVVWFSRRFPIHWDNWQRQLPWHVLASVAVSLIHVLGMVGLRTLAYASQGQPYEFGDWPRELFYEYVKDARTYVGMVVLISFYRLLLRRLQGEASLLAEPDEGQPVEPLDRPERFLVRKLGRDFLVAAADIEWLQASGNYVNLRCAATTTRCAARSLASSRAWTRACSPASTAAISSTWARSPRSSRWTPARPACTCSTARSSPAAGATARPCASGSTARLPPPEPAKPRATDVRSPASGPGGRAGRQERLNPRLSQGRSWLPR